MKKEKIGIFSYDSYQFMGGQGRNIFQIYNEIKDKNEVITFSPFESKIKDSVRINDYNVKFGRNIFFSLIVNLKIRKLISKYNLDKVIFQGGPGGILFIKKLPIEQEYIANHTYYQQTKYIKSQFWKKIFIPFERIGYKNSDKIMSISESTRDVLINNYGISKDKIYLRHPKTDKIFKKIKDIKKISDSILYVGRLDKRKGIDFLVKTMPLIIKENNKIKLFVIGKGKSRYKLEKFVKDNNIKNNVEFLGFVSDKKLLEWYNKCQLTVIPSIFEGFGITAIESLACGTSVIATNSDGLKDIVKDKEMLVEFGNKEDLKDKIVRYFK